MELRLLSGAYVSLSDLNFVYAFMVSFCQRTLNYLTFHSFFLAYKIKVIVYHYISTLLYHNNQMYSHHVESTSLKNHLISKSLRVLEENWFVSERHFYMWTAVWVSDTYMCFGLASTMQASSLHLSITWSRKKYRWQIDQSWRYRTIKCYRLHKNYHTRAFHQWVRFRWHGAFPSHEAW